MSEPTLSGAITRTAWSYEEEIARLKADLAQARDMLHNTGVCRRDDWERAAAEDMLYEGGGTDPAHHPAYTSTLDPITD